MSILITANDLKTKGVSAITEASDNDSEVIITVRGKNKFVVIPIEKYNYLRECELESAIRESEDDIKNNRFIVESIEDHIKHISDV
jgi:prevent-host-death family protein